jgi:tRNA (cmo5U34)-methyltransferase
MSLTFDPNTGDPVHTPKRRDAFEFDSEIASIFENMALRSIPMYAETHNVHAAITKEYADTHFQERQFSVADIGASTGVFLKALSAKYGCEAHQNPSHFRACAIDPSWHMLDKLSIQLPWVVPVNMEAQFVHTLGARFDIVNLSYVLQFIPRNERLLALQSIANSMRSGGLLFVSQKVTINNVFEHSFTDEYIRFRKDNGYSDEEIAAKTEALKNSMWTDVLESTKDMLSSQGFWNFQDTTRWLNFASFVCMKY